MYENNKYEKLVFYLEACESGSMFLNLDASWRIYAVSAASPEESSWAYYCPPDDMVNGIEINSCLGDLFSISWMEDTEGGKLEESLQE
jgi:legumain